MNFKTLSRQYEQEFLDKVFDVLKIPSVYEESHQYPYGKPINDALKKMLSIAREDGFSTKNIEGHGGHIEFGAGEELIGILGHLDVVPAGEGWSSPPFAPFIRGGKLFARGAQDDKGPVLAAYIAMKLLKDQGFQPKKRVRLILGTDEERDWKGIEYYFKHEEMPAVGFTPDASFPVIHAEKGLLDSYIIYELDPEVKEGEEEVLEVSGGDRLNMVPDEAMAVIRTNRDLSARFEVYLREYKLRGNIEETQVGYKVIVNGKAVHSSKPAGGVNAITSLLGFLEALSLNPEVQRIISHVRKAFHQTDGTGLDLKQEDGVSGPLTSNLGSIELKDNTCKVGLNLRYPVTADYENIINKLEAAACAADGTLEIYDHLPSIHLDEDHPFVATLLNVYNKITGEEDSVQSIGGATYARSLQAGVAFGALFQDSPDTAHQVDEHVRISDMVKAIEIYAASIYELTK